MKTLDLPFEQLKISRFNMRVNEKKPDLAHILPSVREKGILMPLIVRPEDGIYGVVAGRTRWFCLNQIVAEQGSTGAVPCCLMEEGDDAAALEASIIENYARKDPLDYAPQKCLDCRLFNDRSLVVLILFSTDHRGTRARSGALATRSVARGGSCGLLVG